MSLLDRCIVDRYTNTKGELIFGIKSFKQKWLEEFYYDNIKADILPEIRDRVFRKLKLIEYATCLNDLRSPPSNRLHSLYGKRNTHMRTTKRKPDSVGTILREEFLEPYNLKQGMLAKAMGVTRTFVNELVNDKRGITVDTAIMLSKVFNTTPEFWIHLQMDNQLWETLHNPQKRMKFKKILSVGRILHDTNNT